MSLKRRIVQFKIRWLEKRKLAIRKLFFSASKERKILLQKLEFILPEILKNYKERTLYGAVELLIDNYQQMELIAKEMFFVKRTSMRRLVNITFRTISDKKKQKLIGMSLTRKLLANWHSVYYNRCFKKYLKELKGFWYRKIFFKRVREIVKVKRQENQVFMFYVFMLLRKSFYGIKYNLLYKQSLYKKQLLLHKKSNRSVAEKFWVLWKGVF